MVQRLLSFNIDRNSIENIRKVETILFLICCNSNRFLRFLNLYFISIIYCTTKVILMLSKVSADFNFDKVVDKKDMDYIIKNFGLQNKTAQNVPKPKTSYKGAMLDSILEQVGYK